MLLHNSRVAVRRVTDGELHSNLLSLFQIKSGVFVQVDCFGIKAVKLSGLRPPGKVLRPSDGHHSIRFSTVQDHMQDDLTKTFQSDLMLLSLGLFVKAGLH